MLGAAAAPALQLQPAERACPSSVPGSQLPCAPAGCVGTPGAPLSRQVAPAGPEVAQAEPQQCGPTHLTETLRADKLPLQVANMGLVPSGGDGNELHVTEAGSSNQRLEPQCMTTQLPQQNAAHAKLVHSVPEGVEGIA